MSPSFSEAVGAETASYASAALPPSLPPQVSTEHPLWATQVHTDTSSVFRRSKCQRKRLFFQNHSWSPSSQAVTWC